LTPQIEHLPSAVIFGCSGTSLPHTPHFGISFQAFEAERQDKNFMNFMNKK